MKKALRIISALLVVVMLGALLAACDISTDNPTATVPATGTGSNPTGTAAAPETTSDFPEQLKGLNFDGEEIGIVMSGGALATRSIYVEEGEDVDETYNVNIAVNRRNEEVAKALNVKFRFFETVAMQSMITYMREYLTSPDTNIDIVGVYQYFDMGLAFGDDAGSFLNYNKIDEENMYLDVNASYWDTDTFNTLAYQNAAFWITGDLSQLYLADMFVSYVNARMWNEFSSQINDSLGKDYEDIYELVYDGKWTIDLWCDLNTLVYNDTNADDRVSDGDRVGYVAFASTCGINNVAVDALFSGCHVTWTKVGSDGIPSIDYNNSSLAAYSNATYQLYKESQSLLLPSYNGDRLPIHIFSDGNALMTVNTLAASEEFLADMTDDYYILPPPKANEAQDTYYTTVGDAVNQFGIPFNVPNQAAATATLEALGYYSQKFVTPEFYDNCLKGRYLRGDATKAADMVDYIHDHIYSDFFLLWAGCLTGSESPSWYLRNNIGSRMVLTTAAMSEAKFAKGLATLLNDLEMSAEVDI